MQTGKKIVESVKETVSNVAASATSGMEKTKATAGEKIDRMQAHDDVEKELATQRKDARIAEAEFRKKEALMHNAAERQSNTPATGGQYSHSTTGAMGQSTGGHQMSALPGHGTGEPAGGHVVEGTVGTRPIAKGTGTNTGRSTTAQNTHVGGGTANSGLTGSGYNG